MTPEEPESAAPSPEAVDAALRAFWRGSSDAVDALVPEEAPRASLGAAFAHLYEATPIESPPEMVTGEYVIVREIGRGGMGVVYEARQETTGRAVALKVMLHRSASDPTHVKLFQREVRTLALLKHPCIATLYDAGQTESGQQYFAMELVRGRALREYCQSLQNPDSQARLLGLFREICEGISYAHQRGVIHRDLKPSNIVIDEDGRPKILDFGLARLVDPDGELHSNVTEAGRLLGTLAYMSPEQARGEADAVDVRSDVYTLGILLYELLTGVRPYEVKTSAWTEAVRTISETPVKRPSMIRTGLRGDLETIVLKALAKDPAERYASAAAFAEDIDRYLTNLPILARPPSGLYQLRKLIVRHKTPAALTAALFLLVAAFAVVFGVQKAQVARQRDEAKAQALRAQRISDYVTNMLQSVDPKSVGASVSVKELLDRAGADLESELANDPETRASMHETLARGYLTLEAYAPCEAHARKALDLRRQLSGERDAAYASALHLLGVVQCRRDKPEIAEKVLREAYDLRLALLGPRDPAIAESLEALADSYFRRNQFPEAERLFRQAIGLLRATPDQKLRLAAAMDGYSVLLTAAGRYQEAEPQLTEALAIRQQIYGDTHFDVARTLTDLGEIYSQWGQYDKAESMHREQVRIFKKLYPDGHVNLSLAYSDLAAILATRDQFSEAEQFFKVSVEMEERIAGPDASLLTKNNYATFLTQQGRAREAIPLSRQVYKGWHGSTTLPDRGKPYACQNLALELLELGELDEAEKLYTDAEHSWRITFGARHPKITNALIGLGRIAEIKGDRVTAERLYREAFDIRRDVLGPTHPETAAAQVYLAGALPPTQPDAIRLCDAALESLQKRWGAIHSEVAWTLGRLAVIQRARGDGAASDQSLGEAIEIERKLPRSRHPNLAACLVERGEILLEHGDVQAAQPLFKEALDIQNERFAATDERITRTKRDLDRCRRSISKS